MSGTSWGWLSSRPAVVTRRRGEPIVLLPLQDYNSIMQTMHLQSSPANIHRLAESMAQLRTEKPRCADGCIGMLKSVDSACKGAAI